MTVKHRDVLKTSLSTSSRGSGLSNLGHGPTRRSSISCVLPVHPYLERTQGTGANSWAPGLGTGRPRENRGATNRLRRDGSKPGRAMPLATASTSALSGRLDVQRMLVCGLSPSWWIPSQRRVREFCASEHKLLRDSRAAGVGCAIKRDVWDRQLRSLTDRGQPAMSWSVLATWSGTENIAQ